MMSLGYAAFVALLFGCAAFLTVQLSAWMGARMERFEDGPQPGRPPALLLVVAGAALGATLAVRGMDPPHLLFSIVLMVALVGSWYVDVLTGIVPDYFTLVPLGLFALAALVTKDYSHLVSALLAAAPFALMAVISRGRGMGWGDVKLAALGGIALGWQNSILYFAAACVVATAVAAIRRRRQEPIAFAPYLAGAIGVALAAH